MTTEEAINALDLLTIVDAPGLREAVKMAIAALRAQQEPKVVEIDQVKNDPLTLDELREMDGEPVYLPPDHRWYIVNNTYKTPWGQQIRCGVDMWGQGTGLFLLAKCGLYRHKPKED